jgi:hypothetical protein
MATTPIADGDRLSDQGPEQKGDLAGLIPAGSSDVTARWITYSAKLLETLEKLHELGGFREDDYGELIRLLDK